VLTSEDSLEPRTVLQLVSERVDGWCWDDTVRQCVPDVGGGNQEGAATDGWQSEIRRLPYMICKLGHAHADIRRNTQPKQCFLFAWF